MGIIADAARRKREEEAAKTRVNTRLIGGSKTLTTVKDSAAVKSTPAKQSSSSGKSGSGGSSSNGRKSGSSSHASASASAGSSAERRSVSLSATLPLAPLNLNDLSRNTQVNALISDQSWSQIRQNADTNAARKAAGSTSSSAAQQPVKPSAASRLIVRSARQAATNAASAGSMTPPSVAHQLNVSAPTLQGTPTARAQELTTSPDQTETINSLRLNPSGGLDLNATLPGMPTPTELAEQHGALVSAANAGDWTAFIPGQGGTLAIKRPDDTVLLGHDAPDIAQQLKSALTDGFGNETWRNRSAASTQNYGNTWNPANASELSFDTPEIRNITEQLEFSDAPIGSANDNSGAIQQSIAAMTGGAAPEILGQRVETPAQRAARELADEKWGRIVDNYVMSTPDYQQGHARLAQYQAQLKNALADTESQISAGTADTSTLGQLNRQRRQLKQALYDADNESDALLERVRAQEIDAGRLEGRLTDETRLKFGIGMENIKGDGTFLGDLMANVEKARFIGSASVLRTAESKLRAGCIMVSTIAAAAQGYDSVYDYIADAEGGAAILADMAFNKQNQLDYATTDFGGDGWNEAQKVAEVITRNGVDLAISAFSGAGGKFVMMALSMPDSFASAAQEAMDYGASAQDASVSGTANAAVSAALNVWGYDKLESAASTLFTDLSPTVRKLVGRGVGYLTRHPALRAFMNVLGASISEGGEEVAEDYVQALVRKAVYDNDTPIMGENGILTVEQLAGDFTVGAAMGGLFTVAAGLGMDKGTRSNALAEDVLNRAQTGRPFDAQLEQLKEALPGEARATETSVADVDAHAEFWSARGMDTPGSLEAWRATAGDAQNAHYNYDIAAQNARALLDRVYAGEFDPAQPDNAVGWNDMVRRLEQLGARAQEAAARRDAARDAYYADEDNQMRGIEAKRSVLESAAQDIRDTVAEATQGRGVTPQGAQSEQLSTAMRTVRDAVLTNVDTSAQVDAAELALAQADGPGAMLKAAAQRDEAVARVQKTVAQLDEARADLARAAYDQSDRDAQMQAGRENSDAHMAQYDNYANAELTGTRERLADYRAHLDVQRQDARGAARARIDADIADVDARLAAIDAEAQLRADVYGSAEYQTAQMRQIAERYAEADAVYQSGAIARQAKLRDFTPQDGKAADAGQYGQTITLGEAAQALCRATQDYPLPEGHEYDATEYDELAAQVAADGGTHTGPEWEKILGFEGLNPRATNLERYVHNTPERVRTRAQGNLDAGSPETVSAGELLAFMRDEMADAAATMGARKAWYERLMAHKDVQVHRLGEAALKLGDRYAAARAKAQFGEVVNADTGVTVALNREGYGKTLYAIGRLAQDVQPAALAALENYRTLMADGVYVGSYPDYGESARIKNMHCFVAAFEYGGEQYRAMYTAKESQNNDGSYSTKLYLQRVEALRAKNSAAGIENRTVHKDGRSGMNYIYPTAETSISDGAEAVNTSVRELLEGYNLGALKSWPLARDADAGRDAAEAGNAAGTGRVRIYRNGEALFSALGDAEIAREIDRANAAAAGTDPDVAAKAIQLRDGLRAERDARSNRSSEGQQRQAVARADRLERIEALISDAPSATDAQLSRERRYLRRELNQLRAALEDSDKADARRLTNDITRIEGNLSDLEQELNLRKTRRSAALDAMKLEMEGDPVRPDAENADGDLERERIRATQQAGRDALNRLKAEHARAGRKWRVTDRISLDEAARIFDNSVQSSADGNTRVATDELLTRNRATLGRWEQRSTRLRDALGDMRKELDTLSRDRAALIESDVNAVHWLDAREGRLRRDAQAAESLIKQADRAIRYLQAHSGDSVLESLRSGHIAEPVMETILGMVDDAHSQTMLSMNINTPARVFDSMFGDAAPVMRAIYLDPVTDAETQRQKYIAECRERISALKLNKAERALVQRYGEGLMTPQELAESIDARLARRGTQLKSGDGVWHGDVQLSSGAADSSALLDTWGDKADEVRRIRHAAGVFEGIYREMWQRQNDALTRNGYEGLGKRQNYFPHFMDNASALTRVKRILGFGGPGYELPTSIAGLTENFTPGVTYNAHAQRRTGTLTTYDCLAGFEDYINASSMVMYHTDNIQRLRQLERSVRGGEDAGLLTRRAKASGADRPDFGNLAMWLHEYANLLAGKKSNLFFDRASEKTGGRSVYRAVDWLRKRRGAAAVAGNISSALTNFVAVPQITAEHPVATIKALGGWFNALLHGDTEGGMPESGFLRRRFGSDELGTGVMARISDWASKPFEIVDMFASNIVVRANYYANLDAGMDAESAMRSADDQAARLMADRSLGQMPNLYSSRTFMATLGQFQLEVHNTVARLAKDIPRSFSPARAAGVIGLTALIGSMVNEVWERIFGRDIMLDPIGSIQEGVEAGRASAQTNGVLGGLLDGIAAGAQDFAGNLPYIGNGRLGTNLLGDAAYAGARIWEAIRSGTDGDAWNEVFWTAMDYVTYGGQIKKSYQGAGALMEGGRYTADGRLMYPIDASDTWTRVKSLILGQYSTDYARLYFDEGRVPLSSDNTARYLQLVQGGMPPDEAYDSLYAYQQAAKLSDRRTSALKKGDAEGAARLQAQIDALMAGVEYETIIPAGLEAELGKDYMNMLETAWRASGDDAFMPEYYFGEFTKDGIKRKFTPESMETLSQVYSSALDKQMATHAEEWPSATDERRAEIYKDCKTNARAIAKQYGFDNGLEYITLEQYEAEGIVAPENADRSAERPRGLTNPINDAYRLLTGQFDTESAQAGDVEAADAAIQGAVPLNLNEMELDGTPSGSHGGSSWHSGSSRRRSSGSRRSNGGSGASSGSGGSGMRIPRATVTLPYYRTRMYAAFGEGYDPFPLSGQFNFNGVSYDLVGDDFNTYSGLYDAWMDMLMRERAQEWDSADSETRMDMLRKLDEQARAAAQEQYAQLY